MVCRNGNGIFIQKDKHEDRLPLVTTKFNEWTIKLMLSYFMWFESVVRWEGKEGKEGLKT